MAKTFKVAGIIFVAVLLLIQLIRPDKTNPPENPAETVYAHLTVPPNVHSILERSCFDCHSNRTRWPWYSNVAPISWMLANDVREGRRHLNFSAWGSYKPKRIAGLLDRINSEVDKGEMPLWEYLLIHRDASLTEEQKDSLCNWAATMGDRVA